MANNGRQGEGREPVYNVNVAGNSAYPRSSANPNNGRQGEGREPVYNVNVAGNSAYPRSSANPNIQNSNTMIQGPARQGQAVHNVNVAGNSANPGNRAYPNIQNSNIMIQGQGQGQDQDQSRVPYGYNPSWYPVAPSNMLHLRPNHNQDFYSANVAGNSTYPYIQNNNMMIHGRRQDQDQSRGPYGYNQTWYPRAQSNMLYVEQPNYTYPNLAPAMDMNMNMNSYNGGYDFNYYHHPPTDGRFHPLQPQPQLSVQPQPWQPQQQLSVQPQQWQPQPQLPVQPQPWQAQPQLPVQPQPRPQPVFDAARRGSFSRHSSGRNSNNLQAARRGRGRVLMHNNYNIDTSFVDALNANADAVSSGYLNAKFFVIKSYSRENVVSSIKHKVWTSTRTGNRILNAAYKGEAHHEQQSVNASCPVLLFFSVQGSGNFCGLAEMDGPVDFEATADCWDRYWKGIFPVTWHRIKDVPYSQFRHITYNTLGNPNQISIAYCKDTHKVEFENGLEMLDIFKRYVSRKSLFGDASTSTASPQNSIDNQRWRLKYKREGQDQDQEGKEEEQDQNQEEQAEVEDKKEQDQGEQPAVDAKQKGIEKEEEGCEQYCIGSASYDTSTNQIKQDTIEESPSDMQLQKIVNTDQEQEEEVEDKQKGKEKEEVEDKQKGKEKEEVDDKQKGKEKEEEGCEQYCIGSANCDIISTNQIKQQDTIEDSPSVMQLQEIVNTEEMQQGHVETNNEPPKATVDTHTTTQVTEANTGYTNQIMTPP